MLEVLSFRNVGPAPELEIQLKPRLNFLAGDNGLGKSFLLDVAWWALTRTWAGALVVPHAPPSEATITYRYGTKSGGPYEFPSSFDRATEEWSVKQGRPAIPGMVIYAQVDGRFSVWDPARNYWKESAGRPPSYRFSAREVWDGLPLDEPRKLCNGLIADWASWQLEKGEAFAQLTQVLEALAPSGSESLRPGELKKISLEDARRHPTLKMPYGQEVALVHASAGMRRIVSLAYLLVWTWQEHVSASSLRGDAPTREIIFLVDEIEAHLHPQWQRRIVPALLQVMEALTGEHDVSIQIVAASHSPLVLASIEPVFDGRKDAVWELDLIEGGVQLEESPWYSRGDASNWLTSSVFDLGEARSLAAEEAIEGAKELLRRPGEPILEDAEAVDARLRRAALPDIDPFWVRWGAFMESLRGDV